MEDKEFTVKKKISGIPAVFNYAINVYFFKIKLRMIFSADYFALGLVAQVRTICWQEVVYFVIPSARDFLSHMEWLGFPQSQLLSHCPTGVNSQCCSIPVFFP